MTDRIETRKDEIVAEVLQLCSSRLGADEAPAVAAFAGLWLRDIPPGDLAAREPQDLYGALLNHWRFAARRMPGTTLVRAYNPALDQQSWQSTHTVVELVNDDMPFLVDSVRMELNRNGLSVHLIVHPIVRVLRDGEGRLLGPAAPGEGLAESFLHFEVDRISDPDKLRALEADLARVMSDVRRTVRDWQAMRGRVPEAIAELRPPASEVDPGYLGEVAEFLGWLADDHFIFMGSVTYDLVNEVGRDPDLVRIAGSALGILDSQRDALPSRSFASLSPSAKKRAVQAGEPLIVTKANSRSTVHRPTWLDLISVKRYAEDGSVLGEHRFLGLFTSAAYNRNPADIPLLRGKVQAVIARAALGKGHAGKALVQILESFPRDELFQSDLDTLYDTAIAILHLQDRQRLRLFLRPDPFGRLVSCLVFVPREGYNTSVRQRIQRILERALDSHETEFNVQLSESPLARILFTVRTTAGVPPEIDVDDLERRLAEAAISWSERLHRALVQEAGEEAGNRLFARFGRGFPTSYQERWPARAAVADVHHLAEVTDGAPGQMALSLYHRLEDPANRLHFKLIRADRPVTLADALPILERMDLRVIGEATHLVTDAAGRSFAIHDFEMDSGAGGQVSVDQVRLSFQATFRDAFLGRAESDGFDRLVLLAGLQPREILILRSACKYLLQVGIPFSQSYIEATLANNPALASLVVRLFLARLDPVRDGRDAQMAEVEGLLATALDRVTSLDEDRILRAFVGLVQAILRTNWFQPDPATGEAKPHLSFKVDPGKVPYMPLPKPLYEIFVYAPFVEAVHLRGGKVARGGIRWSDRREDFRTEVLGLMKAQMVKNSVIVPVGAKGGFIVKRPPAGGDRQAMLAEAIRCYETFLHGMLDITDNRTPDGIAPPPAVLRYDDDDPYLVVAADKGTATFSDFANRIAVARGFWLGDAFASGGSAGYDHKVMGITAKGAWESVRRHFRESGLDPDQEPFTVVGIGDMSGDVFGNGMLLSDKIRLIAAFDHRHVFLDPAPDIAASFAERQRLFALPRSSWADYDPGLISAGGGVFPRTAKSIALTPEVQAALAVTAASLAPAELIQAILKAPVDLLWNGGIGTYVKARAEGQAAAQDRSNDPVRVDGEDLRCKVLVEGGNLGLTQRGRIAAALAGVRLNTDFIDNSAGVDCSDHEVNIKILLGDVVASGDLTLKQRDETMARMTDEVSLLVLRDNILQNQALSMGQAMAPELLDAQARLMRQLERHGRLNRELEYLPTDSEIDLRRKAGRGLTRPEAAVLLANAKMSLYAELLATELPDRQYFSLDLAKYFPRELRRRFPEAIGRHRLRREIVATALANSLVNRGLDVFVSELRDETGASLDNITLAYVIARDAFGLLPFWAEVEALPRSVPADLQISLLLSARAALVDGTRWFVAHGDRPLVIRDQVGHFKPAIRAVMDALPQVLPPEASAQLQTESGLMASRGLADGIAANAAALPFLLPASDAALVARREPAAQNDPVRAARVLFALDQAMDLDGLRARAAAAPIRSRWDRLALTGLRDEIAAILRRLTSQALAHGVATDDPVSTGQAVRGFLERQVHGHTRFQELSQDLARAGTMDVSMLAVAVRVLADLAPVD